MAPCPPCPPWVPPALNSRGRFWLGIAALKTAMKGILGFRFVPKDFNHGDCLSLEEPFINCVDKRFMEIVFLWGIHKLR